MKKKFLGYALGAVAALTLCMGTALAQTTTTSGTSSNQPLQAGDLFGGQGTSPTDFAGNAGLSQGNLVDTISAIIRTILGFLGIVAVVIILFGGFQWMTAGGSPEKVKGAKTLIIQGIIGLVIVLCSFAIAQFVISSIVSATNQAATTTTQGS